MHHLTVVLDNLRSSHNVGSIVRSAVCFQVSDFIAVGTTPYPKIANDPRLPHIVSNAGKQIYKTSLGAEKHANFTHFSTPGECIAYLHRKKISLIALEQSQGSLPLNGYRLQEPSALVIGNEVNGVSDEFMAAAEKTLEIHQPGPKESLNASVAAGIAFYELTK